MAADVPKLPACERCRSRKVKCDGASPKCASCHKSASACIIIDPVTRERCSRGAIAELERDIRSIEAEIAARSTTSLTSSGRTQTNHDYPGEQPPNLSRQAFYDSHVLSPGQEIKAHDLPTFDTAQTMLHKYFKTSHLHHPIIPRATVYASLSRVYRQVPDEPTNQDHYMIFMLLAVSSVTLYRRGQLKLHPYGFFHSAQQFMPKIQLVSSIVSIQNLLIFARFAMYYHVNYSIWDITRNCMRQCIELGLHRTPRTSLTPMEEQNQRNIFWDTYVHDRYASGILGRPYAISDNEIEVCLPVEASEQDICSATAASLNEINVDYLQRPNETSVSLYVIGLRKITTRVHNRFFSASKSSKRTITNAGEVLSEMEELIEQFNSWLAGAPKFTTPQSLYERSEWHQFLMEKDKLYLLRGALARVPVFGLSPPRTLLLQCLSCASLVIELYDGMFQKSYITWTRSYFQIMFTCGLSIVYTLSILTPAPTVSSRELETSMEVSRGRQALKTVQNLLRIMVREMPDIDRFVIIIDALIKPYVTRAPTRAMSEAAPEQIQYNGLVMPMETAPRTPNHLQAMQQTEDETSVSGPFDTVDHFLPDVYDHTFDFNLEMTHLQHWPQSMGHDNMFGQLEAGLGEYAWGNLVDGNAWNQIFAME